MKYNIVKTKERKDGGLDIQMECDEAFIQFCVQQTVIRALEDAIKEDKLKNSFLQKFKKFFKFTKKES